MTDLQNLTHNQICYAMYWINDIREGYTFSPPLLFEIDDEQVWLAEPPQGEVLGPFGSVAHLEKWKENHG